MHCIGVSIPFKRESIYKENPHNLDSWGLEFQFPSNGKAYTKQILYVLADIVFTVFQFPSNGKAYTKRKNGCTPRLSDQVSIPFKRETISKGKIFVSVRVPSLSFNSLQTGKHIQRGIIFLGICALLVSIPFKRESISKDPLLHPKHRQRKKGFNSLQTGKHIQRLTYMLKQPKAKSFNSLQTGNHIQRCEDRLHRISQQDKGFQFPSNGKAYTKKRNARNGLSVWQAFQFPSNGKPYTKESR